MRVYAFKGTPEILEQSSSGGAFTKIVDVFCEKYVNDFSIYGAVWTDDLNVMHCRVTKKENASIFKGSKYVRSNIKGVYCEVKEDLEKGMAVLFSGTPCQISGLKAYLKQQKVIVERLLTVDIICHGSPDPIIFQDFKYWIEKLYLSKIKKITFRDKSVGWRHYPTRIEFENGKILRWSYDAQLYIRMYFSLLILDAKCYSCKYSNMNRVSDITIGDFWGIDKILPEIPEKKGVSLVIANTDHGTEILEKIQNNLKSNEILKEYQGNEYLKFQNNLNRPTEMPSDYKDFWLYYRKYGFYPTVKKYGFYTLKGKLKFFVKKILLHIKWLDKRLF